jgi:glycosyltransferase involved in cell wall biosynthesis
MSNNQPLISVIIPCYNGEKYLSQALESLLWQTYSNWECILVDDGSTDRSAEIFNKYSIKDNRFRYLYQNNQGPSVARNYGIDSAKGKFIQFLDADDILLPQRFELCIDEFNLHPDIDVIYTDHIRFSLDEGYRKGLPAKIPHNDIVRAFMFEMDRTFAIIIHSFLFKSTVFINNRFNVELKSHGEDVECWIRIAICDAQFHYIDQILSIYRYVPHSLARDEVSLYLAKLKVLELYKNHQKSIEYQHAYTQMVQHYYERLTIAYFFQKKINLGINQMRSIWATADSKSKLKMIAWFVSMLFFTSDTVRKFVHFVQDMLLQKPKLNWNPPKVVDILLHPVNDE